MVVCEHVNIFALSYFSIKPKAYKVEVMSVFCILLAKTDISRHQQTTTAWTCHLHNVLLWNWPWGMMFWQWYVNECTVCNVHFKRLNIHTTLSNGCCSDCLQSFSNEQVEAALLQLPLSSNLRPVGVEGLRIFVLLHEFLHVVQENTKLAEAVAAALLSLSPESLQVVGNVTTVSACCLFLTLNQEADFNEIQPLDVCSAVICSLTQGLRFAYLHLVFLRGVVVFTFGLCHD